jgi:predicted outer membrane repeat protein
VFIGTIFQGNRATNSGGAINSKNSNYGSVMVRVNFTENRAEQDGGGVILSTAHYGNMLIECTFASNYAGGNGGGLAMVTDNGEGLMSGDGGEFVSQRYSTERGIQRHARVYGIFDGYHNY